MQPELVKLEVEQKIIEKALEHKKKYLDKNSDNDGAYYSYQEFLKDIKKQDSDYLSSIFFRYINTHDFNNIDYTNKLYDDSTDCENESYSDGIDNYIKNIGDNEEDNITKLISNLSDRKKQINQISSLIDLLSNNDIEEVLFRNNNGDNGCLSDNNIIEKIKNIALSELKDKLIDLNIEIKDMLKEAYSS